MGYQDQIDEIMDSFDFEELSRIFATMGWRYAEKSDPPDARDLRKVARELLRNAVTEAEKGNHGYTSSGRLTAANINGRLCLFGGVDCILDEDGQGI